MIVEVKILEKKVKEVPFEKPISLSVKGHSASWITLGRQILLFIGQIGNYSTLDLCWGLTNLKLLVKRFRYVPGRVYGDLHSLTTEL